MHALLRQARTKPDPPRTRSRCCFLPPSCIEIRDDERCGASSRASASPCRWTARVLSSCVAGSSKPCGAKSNGRSSAILSAHDAGSAPTAAAQPRDLLSKH
eukprot:6193637-Pleurochrysis_carterae.AAC.4